MREQEIVCGLCGKPIPLDDEPVCADCYEAPRGAMSVYDAAVKQRFRGYVDTGSEWVAPVRVSDIRAALNEIAQLRERLKWFEASGGVVAHTRVFREMARAEDAEALAARYKAALEQHGYHDLGCAVMVGERGRRWFNGEDDEAIHWQVGDEATCSCELAAAFAEAGPTVRDRTAVFKAALLAEQTLALVRLVQEARRILLAERTVPCAQTTADKAAWLAEVEDKE